LIAVCRPIVLAAALSLSLFGCAAREGAPPAPRATAGVASPIRLGDLPGWRSDRQSQALVALTASCGALLRQSDETAVGPAAMAGTVADWRPVCAGLPPAAADDAVVRRFLESRFLAIAIEDADRPAGLFTGYYEPELTASRHRSARFSVPLYRRPPDLVDDAPYRTRAEIDSGALAGRHLELFWLADPLDAFFLQVQGSGRLRLLEGGTVRVGFAGSNGRPYTAIGRLLVERGELTKDTVSLQTIRDWLRAHPAEAGPLMRQNARYVFFKEVHGAGPIGAEGVPLTPGRSLAIDPTLMPLGVPFWLDTSYPVDTPEAGRPLQRLVVAQDIGAAIKGSVRGDLFWGSGDTAMRYAGRMKQPGRYFLLLPSAVAERRAGAS